MKVAWLSGSFIWPLIGKFWPLKNQEDPSSYYLPNAVKGQLDWISDVYTRFKDTKYAGDGLISFQPSDIADKGRDIVKSTLTGAVKQLTELRQLLLYGSETPDVLEDSTSSGTSRVVGDGYGGAEINSTYIRKLDVMMAFIHKLHYDLRSMGSDMYTWFITTLDDGPALQTKIVDDEVAELLEKYGVIDEKQDQSTTLRELMDKLSVSLDHARPLNQAEEGSLDTTKGGSSPSDTSGLAKGTDGSTSENAPSDDSLVGGDKHEACAKDASKPKGSIRGVDQDAEKESSCKTVNVWGIIVSAFLMMAHI
ncbi:hypothetical protein BgAZ_502500 [Babesia gibsoni]|uniref:Uncharacterized protein n=1 Tax=Babesia gibsoni TaxID=33632 RepID=A0AAD8PCC6_BABGI|nr:hypothetical protein BgAZ_502500 [Babesia gibsoni]